MMFLVESNLLKVTKQQYSFKLKAYFKLFFNLIIFQIIGILLGFAGMNSESIGSSGMNSIKIYKYSSLVVTIFTFIMLFSIAFIVQTEKYKELDKAIVCNRCSSSLSDIFYIITLCIFGGITTSLSGVFLRVVVYFIKSSENIVGAGFFISPRILLIGMLSTLLYAVIISSLAYVFGALVNISKVFSVIIPAFIIGLIYLYNTSGIFSDRVIKILSFYTAEASMLYFIAKIVVTSVILFAVAVKLDSNLEVRR